MAYDYDFVVDEGHLDEVGTTMTGKADEIRTKIQELYGIIDDELFKSWKGAAYNTFKEACHNYEPGLYEVANMIEAFGKTAMNLSDAANTLLNDIKNEFK